MRRAVVCPACGSRMGKGDVRYGGFRCPACDEALDVDRRYTFLTALASAVLAVLISYAAGLSGVAFLLACLILYFIILLATAFITGWFRPKLVRQGRAPTYGVDFRITSSPDAPKKNHNE